MVMTAFFAIPFTADAAGSYPEGLSGHFEIVEQNNWEEEYDIYNGFHHPTVVNNAPNATYDYKTNTLTLTNFTNGATKNFNLQCDQMLDLTIKVVGNCSIGRMELFDTYPTFTGTGTLTINPNRDNFVGLHIDLHSADVAKVTPLKVTGSVTVKVLGSSDSGATPIDIRYRDKSTTGIAATKVVSYAKASATLQWDTETTGGPRDEHKWWSDYNLNYVDNFPHLKTVFPYTKLLKMTGKDAGTDNIFVVSQENYSSASNHWVHQLQFKDGVWYEVNDVEHRYYTSDGYTYTHYTYNPSTGGNVLDNTYYYFEAYTSSEFDALPDTIKSGGNVVANVRCADMGRIYTDGTNEYLLVEGRGYYPAVFEPTNMSAPTAVESGKVLLTVARVNHSNETYWVEDPVNIGGIDQTDFNTDNDAINAFVKTNAGYDPAMMTVNEGYTHIYRLKNASITFSPATPAHTHSYSWVVTKAATCTTAGTKAYKCSCGNVSKTETIAATGHSWNAGTVTKAATYTATGVKTYTCTKCKATKTETIAKKKKKANTITVSAKKATFKYSKLKKKNQTLKVEKFLKVTKAKGTVTYKKTDGNKKITIDKKSGKLTVKKGLKKGTYKVKIKVTAAGTTSYKSGYKTVTVKVVVE
jgi:hypothetical protein